MLSVIFFSIFKFVKEIMDPDKCHQLCLFQNATNSATGFGVYKQMVDKMPMNPKMAALDPALAALHRRHPAGPSGILKDCWDQ